MKQLTYHFEAGVDGVWKVAPEDPVIQFDYFPQTGIKGIAGIESLHSFASSTTVQCKGSQDQHAVNFMAQFMTGVGYQNFTVMTDGEPAVVDFARACIERTLR